jgi:type I restriction enzyme S subunit
MFELRALREAVAKQVGGGTPSRQISSYWNGPIPWASVKDFSDDDNVLVSTKETITEKGLLASASNLVIAETPLVCTRMAVGRSAMASMPIAINQDVKALLPAVGTDPSYLLRLLQHVRPRAEAIAVGSTVKGIRIEDYLSIETPIAPAAEQPEIARILGILDTAIRQTEAIVEKLKQVKQGLLHDLLAHGIDAKGELRPSQSQAPHLYKISALGWIPKTWETVTLGKLATDSVLGPFGSDLVANDYRTSGTPVVFVRDVKANQFKWKSQVFVGTAKAQALSSHNVRPGDVVATKMGFPPCVAAVYPESMPHGIVTADIVRLRFNLDEVRPLWISVSINETAVVKQVEQITAGITRPKVTLRDVRKLVIRHPPLHEQDAILTRMASLEKRIAIEEASALKLATQRSGLMDDLLTGRVRVTPLLQAAIRT